MRTPPNHSWAIFFILVLVAGCKSGTSSDDTSDGGPHDASTPVDLSLLPTGTHLSAIITFEPLPAVTADEADRKWQQAIAAGMDTARIQLDWAGLETAPGVFEKATLRDALEAMKADGLKPFVEIQVIDSEGLVLPSYLRDESTPTGIVDGLSLDSPRVVDRYNALLDWAVPMIVEEGGWGLGIANEPEGYIEDHPTGRDGVVPFYQQVIEHAHSIDGRLPITVTLTSSILDRPDPFFAPTLEAIDFASFNYYCLKVTDRFVLRGPIEQTVPDDIQTLVAHADGKEVIFHELGCPAGYSDKPSIIGTSAATQQRFFDLAFAAIKSEPKVRFASVFLMVDWSTSLFDSVYRPILEQAGLPAVFIDSFEEWLTTSGFITYQDGRERPSWATFIAALQ